MQSEQKQVLLVDDDEETLKMVESFLRRHGYAVLTAKDASEALKQTDGTNLGLIVLDLDLHGEDGTMLMRFLKRNLPDVPLIIYTALKQDEEKVQQLLLQGAHQYLHKGPLSELLGAVRRSYR